VTRCLAQRTVEIRTEQVRELLSHGGMTDDSVMTTFLEVMTCHLDLSYLSTYFTP
jgi:uncharacterized protein YgbK (DUF1537 family)